MCIWDGIMSSAYGRRQSMEVLQVFRGGEDGWLSAVIAVVDGRARSPFYTEWLLHRRRIDFEGVHVGRIHKPCAVLWDSRVGMGRVPSAGDDCGWVWVGGRRGVDGDSAGLVWERCLLGGVVFGAFAGCADAWWVCRRLWLWVMSVRKEEKAAAESFYFHRSLPAGRREV